MKIFFSESTLHSQECKAKRQKNWQVEEENHFSAIEKEILIFKTFKTYLELLVLDKGEERLQKLEGKQTAYGLWT